MHSRTGAKVLTVDLFGTLVGTLTWLPNQQIVFAFAQEYLFDSTRPTLSLSYRDTVVGIRTGVKPTSIRVPPFFSNLLPEGKLRSYLARKANVSESQEFFLLAALAQDLPGAVRLVAETSVEPPGVQPAQRADESGVLRFSLAGMQLKLSGDLRHQKVTIPASGLGGHWIVKLPVAALPRINELEYSMLMFAREIGIDAPDVQLVPIQDIDGIPQDLPETMSGDCLISRRFDRKESSERVHTEDFCQVFGLYDKYDPQFNYQSIASVLWTEVGLRAVEEFIRRLVFSVAIGNADMHLKNWSLIYPDRRNPVLSPAYDFVPSAPAYPHTYQKLALKLAGENRFERIDIEHFKKLAAIAKLPERAVLSVAREAVASIHEVWPRMQNDLPISASDRRLISEQIEKSGLLYYQGPKALHGTHEPAASASSQASAAITAISLAGDVTLDQTVPSDKISYQSSTGRTFELSAPRRMVTMLLMEQLNKLLKENPELNGETFTAHVGPALFYEWREENIPRIESRQLNEPLTAQDLEQQSVSLTGTFFPLSFQKLQKMHALRQTDSIDFVLNDGRLWTAQGQIRSISDASGLEDGRRFATVELDLRNPIPVASTI